jgi:moderate conductance mechanosensitive channel
MERKNKMQLKHISWCFVTTIIMGLLSMPLLFSEEEPETTTVSALEAPPQAVKVEPVPLKITTDHEAVEKIEKKEEETKKEIKEKEIEITEAAEKAEKVRTEKDKLKKTVAQKTEEVQLVKKELQAVKAEAALTKDPQAAAEARKLQVEAEQVEAEKQRYESKLQSAEVKTERAEKIVEKHADSVEALKAQIVKLKAEKSTHVGLVDRFIQSIFIVGIGFIFFLMLMFATNRFEHLVTRKEAIRESELVLRLKTITALLRWMGGLVIFSFVVYSVLAKFGIDMAPLLAGAGIIGLAFGFGGQYLIRDIINGVFILIEGQYRINDVVKIGDEAGLVESVNLRVTRLRDLEGRVIFIPNGEIKTVINYTKEFGQALMDIGVAYKENVDRVMEVMHEVARQMRQDSHYGPYILQDLEMFGVDDFADSAVMIKCRIKTLPIKQWTVMREFKRRLKNRFDELGIEIPFPHRTVYWGAGSDNDWWRKK